MISIIRDRTSHGSVLPEAFGILGGLPAEVQHHALYSLRPAGAIYNVSLNLVISAFKTVLQEIDQCETTGKPEGDHFHFDATRLLNAQNDLLLKMSMHIDECYLVLKALQPAVSVQNPHSFTDRWLQQARHPTIANFKRAIESYETRLMSMVNRIKHNQARLRTVSFFWPGVHLYGYFVEGVDASGALGPDKAIHLNGGGFSFPADLRRHFSALYLIGHALEDAVKKALFKQQGFRAKRQTTAASQESAIVEVASKIEKLPRFIFPDEIPNEVPGVKVFKNESTEQLILDHHENPLMGFPPGGTAITSAFEGDGHTRTYTMPYLKNPPPEIRRGRII